LCPFSFVTPVEGRKRGGREGTLIFEVDTLEVRRRFRFVL